MGTARYTALLLRTVVLATLSLPAWAQTAQSGIALHGDIKYPATFTHFDYVNADAPKGGDFHFSSLGTFDIVFCRNVAIYFNERDRISLFKRIEQRLEANGCLVIGSMESLSAISPQFESKRHLRSVYYQVKSAAAARI